MKKIIILIFILNSCTAQLDLPNLMDKNMPTKSASITYEGFYLKSLQVNEDETYRIEMNLPNGTVRVVVSVPKEFIIIEKEKPISAVYYELNNGVHTNRYIIYLQPNFLITKYFT